MLLIRYNSVFVHLCSPNTCKGVFNSNVATFQSNCAEGLDFSAFHVFMYRGVKIAVYMVSINHEIHAAFNSCISALKRIPRKVL